MKKIARNCMWSKRWLALALAVVMVWGMLPTPTASAEESQPGTVTTVADPETLTRPETIYGDNTLNAGKVTVGKSVSTTGVSFNFDNDTVTIPNPDTNNFLVTVSQSAQVMGLSSQSDVPVDVVFVLDTSGSMNQNGVDRVTPMVNAANSAIATLLAANPDNRIGVVAFSSAGNYGGGTSGGAAANVLSSLAHYEDDAATAHLTRVNQNGNVPNSGTGSYIAGRDTTTVTTGGGWPGSQNTRTVRNYRHGSNGGTNIQAGIALGAQMLTSVSSSDTYIINEDGEQVTRMPFIIVLSDGAPTFSSTSSTWYEPSMSNEQGPGSSSYAGNGFLAALTAAYYKGKITEHYYGANASEDNRCSIYTLGVQLDSLGNNDKALAQVTMNPKEYLSATDNSFATSFRSYWASFTGGNNFNILVDDDDDTFQVTATSISAASNYVNGKNASGVAMYTGGLTYNDGYYNATSTDEIAAIFDNIVQEISKKAMSAPTKVTGSHDFSGYVTFTDIIGEYMEVKDMKGIVADGYLYRGATFARLVESYGTSTTEEQLEFNALLEEVLTTRLTMSASDASAFDFDAYMQQVQASANQGSYTDANNFDNSMCWWGNAAPSDEEDEVVQWLGFADDDSIEYITSTQPPAGADHVCRSYFFYGTAGGIKPNADHEYLYFVVRVQRSLTAPYQQTVVISAPASLLSMEEVLITETTNNDGTKSYTATVTEEAPARVVYEVGLRSDITAGNVAAIVSDDYKNETVNGEGSVNYDAATDTYSFFTNDWNRSESLDSHHRAMTKATFDAAADNSFYTYQEDTLILDANGDPYTGTTAPVGNYYYARTYYDWAGQTASNGTYTATQKTALIPVNLPEGHAAVIQGTDGNWYIAKGAYTDSTLVVNGDDTEKGEGNNLTGTSSIVAHPHRTDTDHTNSHYTVYLGNNGKLSLVAEDLKTVDITPANGTTITNADGNVVMVGDILTYHIKAENTKDQVADIVITDQVPAGTEYVENSVSEGGVHANGKLTWTVEDVNPGEAVTVSFQVKVTPAALDLASAMTINNVATIQIGNDPAFNTNTTTNPPEGKITTDASGSAITGDVYVGQVLEYHIRFHNDEATPADVTITDIIPDGTTYVSGSATHGGVYDAAENTITWSLAQVQPGYTDVVSFQVIVNAAAVTENKIQNNASIKVGDNDPRQTNTTEILRDSGNLVLTKTVDAQDHTPDPNQSFKLTLEESTGTLNGTFSGVTFLAGKATVEITDGQSLTITGLPTGSVIYVTEDVPNGYTVSYTVTAGGVAAAAATASATVPENDTVTVEVTNTYAPGAVNFQLKGTKAFSGVGFPAGTFTFQAVQCNADGTAVTDPIVVTAVATSNGVDRVEFAFSNRSFTKATTRYYKVSEAATTIPGVTVSNVVYLLEVKAVDDGSGQLKVETRIKKGSTATIDWSDSAIAWQTLDWQNDSTTITFENTYKPAQTTLTLGGGKVLTGRYLNDGEFSFELISNGVTVSTARVVAEGTDHDGTYSFQPITYTEAGVHTYTIREVNSGDPRVNYDETYYVVTVTVADEGGQLKTSTSVVKHSDGSQTDVTVEDLDFENAFISDGTTVRLTGTKTLSGEAADGLTAGEFTFSIYEADANGVLADDVSDFAGSVNADGTISFAEFVYTAEDMVEGTGHAASRDFYYVVKENIPVAGAPTYDPNMYYDQSQYLVKVTVTYSTNGTMAASVSAVSKWDGTQWVSQEGTSVAFNNIQNPSSVSVPLSGSKTTIGTALPAGLSFSFRVVSAGPDGQYGTADDVLAATGTSAVTGSNDGANKAITFSNLVYTEVGTYEYMIMESNTGSSNGVEYDKAQYRVVVEVSRNATNKLAYEVSYFAADGTPVSAPTFNNTYAANAHINLTASKVLTGRALEANEFDFRLQRLDSTGNLIAGSAINGTNAAAAAGEKATVTFATLNFSNSMLTEEYKVSDGVYVLKYLMSEIKPADVAIPGMTYDTATYTITVRLTQGEDEALSAKLVSVTDAAGNEVFTADEGTDGTTDANIWNTDVTFNNSYATVHGTSAAITAEKDLSGRDLAAGEFSFKLEIKDANEPTGWREVATATNAADGTVTFTRTYPANMDEKYFDGDTATLIYRITEVVPSTKLPGVEYNPDNEVYYAKVVIEHDTDSASLKLAEAVTYYTDEACTEAAADVVIHNIYEAEGTSFTPDAHKTLEGAKALAADEFSFVVQQLNPADSYAVIGSVSTGTNDAQGNVSFGAISYMAAGTYYYAISEAQGTDSTITYDKTVYYLKVVVSDNTETGKLEITSAEYFKDTTFSAEAKVSAVEFTNHYGSGYVNVDLSLDKAFKTPVTGSAYEYALNGSEFDFNVYASNADFSTIGELVTSGTNGVANAQNGYVADITFGTITYTRQDVWGSDAIVEGQQKTATFYYVVKEEEPSNADERGIEIDTTLIGIKVVVTDNGYGNLKTDVTYPNGTKFVNTYDPAPATLEIPVTKFLSNKNFEQGDVFTFDLVSADGKGYRDSVTNDAAGNAVFKLTYKPEDFVGATKVNGVLTKTFAYTLTESETMPTHSKGKFTHDPAVYKIVVTVTDQGDGQLRASAAFTRNEISTNVIEFNNKYTPDPITEDLSGKIDASKKVVSPEGETLAKDLAGFKFEVVDLTGTPVATGESNADGLIEFSEFTFTQAGEYFYRIAEVDEVPEGYTVDIQNWSLRILVKYNEATGALYIDEADVITAPVGSEAGTNDDPVFVNTYEPLPTSITINTRKQISDNDGNDTHDRPLADREFTFRLLQGNMIVAEAHNTADGTVTFNVEYTKPGTYTYQIREVKPENGLPGITYDGSYTEFTVTVVDEDGQLVAKSGSEVVNTVNVGKTFINTYSANPVSITLSGIKILKDRPMNEGEFTFELYAADSNFKTSGTPKTVTNAANGQFIFEETYTDGMEGTHYYVIREQAGDLESVRYDNTEYRATVVISDLGNGQLVAQVTVDHWDPNTETLTPNAPIHFTNDYGVWVKIEKTQTVENGTATKATELVEAGDTVTYTVTVTNPSQGPAQNVVVKDEIPTGLTLVNDSITAGGTVDANGVITWNVGMIEAGASASVSFQVTVPEVEADTSWKNVATATHDDEPDPEDSNEVEIVEPVPTKDVFLEGKTDISVDGKNVTAGDVLTYQITYANLDDEAATVTIVDTVPNGTSIVADSISHNGKAADGKITWTVDLAVGQSVTVSFDVTVDQPGVAVLNQANVQVGQNAWTTNQVSNSTPKKTVDQTTASKDDILTYTVTYTNTTGAAANVKIVDKLDGKLLYVNGTATNGGVYDAETKTVTWEYPAVAAGETVAVTFQAKVGAAGIVANSASIYENGSEISTNPVKTEVRTPGLAISKTQTVGSGAATAEVTNVKAGDVVTYTITVSNNDLGTAYGVTVTDKIPAGLTYVAGSANNNADLADGVLTWQIAEILPNETVVLTFKATVPAVTTDTQWKNVATMVDDDVPTDSNEVVTQTLLPNVNVVKQQAVNGETAVTGGQKVASGDTVTYYLTVSNTGKGVATNLTVADKIPAGLLYVEGSADNGGKLADGVISWSLDTLASGQCVTLSFQVTVPEVSGDESWTNVATFDWDENPEDPKPSNEVELDPEEPEVPEVPEGPETGDDINLPLWGGLMISSLAALIFLFFVPHRKRGKYERA